MTIITPRKRSYYFTKGGHGSSVDRKNEDDSDEYDDSHQKGYEDYNPHISHNIEAESRNMIGLPPLINEQEMIQTQVGPSTNHASLMNATLNDYNNRSLGDPAFETASNNFTLGRERGTSGQAGSISARMSRGSSKNNDANDPMNRTNLPLMI